ncbi:hypothetical protein [Babesia ovata]|uniref:Uncharacterized protein n=1 Tax=Babesia ovata TaxID=189622 RepID=A0A2H6K8W4_9APIC|nr:hypothetical protein [Babesia ovata]GBE59437.1 hypothetical protein [Babesia ovata]
MNRPGTSHFFPHIFPNTRDVRLKPGDDSIYTFYSAFLTIPLNFPNLTFNMPENLFKIIQIAAYTKLLAKRPNRLGNFFEFSVKRPLDHSLKLTFKSLRLLHD